MPTSIAVSALGRPILGGALVVILLLLWKSRTLDVGPQTLKRKRHRRWLAAIARRVTPLLGRPRQRHERIGTEDEDDDRTVVLADLDALAQAGALVDPDELAQPGLLADPDELVRVANSRMALERARRRRSTKGRKEPMLADPDAPMSASLPMLANPDDLPDDLPDESGGASPVAMLADPDQPSSAASQILADPDISPAAVLANPDQPSCVTSQTLADPDEVMTKYTLGDQL